MTYGRMGTTLEIDLSKGTVEKRDTDPELTRLYLGGKGTNARIFWERIPPETEPFSPENLLIIDTCVLTGTMVPAANRGVVTFKSPVNGFLMNSALGGLWPAELKHAGYDTIIIRGKSPVPVYLWINDDDVQLRDAKHLWGKGTPDTMQEIRDELGNNQVHIACIGPAGENRCHAATIESAVGAGASRAGPGAIMGDKNLKAIAAHGTRDVRIAKPQRLVELCEEIMERSGPLKERIDIFGQNVIIALIRDGVYGNLDERFMDLSPESEFRKALERVEEHAPEWVKKNDGQGSCHNCGFRCRKAFRHPGGGISYIKCGSWTSFVGACKLFDYDFTLECYRLSLHYGMDTMSVSRCIAFAIDLYEKGILTKADTDGMHLEYGNKEIVYSLIEKIGKREGIGDLLANGVLEAARQIGRGAEYHVHLIKKLDHIQDTNLAFQPILALMLAVSDKADPSRLWNMNLLDFYEAKGEDRKAVVDSIYWNYPEEYKAYFLAEPSWDGTDYEPFCQFVAYDADRYTILDMTGICAFWAVFVGHSPFNSVALIAELAACAMGLDIDEAELMTMAGRTMSLIRAINVRMGLTKKDDSLAKPFYKLPPPPGFKRHDPELVAKWVERYYELKGWNREGVPTWDRLQELGLNDVAQDLKQRGFLKEKIK